MKADEDLFQAYGERGDRSALEELFERHRPDVYGAARRILRNEADALDATQRTFLNALQSLPRLKEGSRFPGWLRRIAVNVALEMRRSRLSEEMRSRKSPAPPPPAGGGVDPESQAILQRALEDLPEEYRLPILLHHCEGLTYEEIARILGCPRGTVGTNIHRGLERLRRALSPRLELSDQALAALLGGPPANPDSAWAAAPPGWA
ncbi:MAG TPA: RNA polymerase sigma factor [Planctomycetota bacterium]|nr:RNA polymerase sigma factor [Planctomycetota bacterium]